MTSQEKGGIKLKDNYKSLATSCRSISVRRTSQLFPKHVGLFRFYDLAFLLRIVILLRTLFLLHWAIKSHFHRTIC